VLNDFCIGNYLAVNLALAVETEYIGGIRSSSPQAPLPLRKVQREEDGFA